MQQLIDGIGNAIWWVKGALFAVSFWGDGLRNEWVACVLQFLCTLKPGNPNLGGRYSTVDLLIKVAYFLTKIKYIFSIKMS